MQVATIEPRRHPVIVSTDGPFTTAAEDYTPPAELNSGLITGFPWGRRMVRLKPAGEQFMVYDWNGRNVLASGRTPVQAAEMAVRRLEREALPPSHYQPVLEGCRFDSRADDEGPLLIHQVIGPDGVVIAESDLGREAVCKLAASMQLAQFLRNDLSFEEFSLIAFPVAVDFGTGRGTYGAVFSAGEAGRHALRAMLQSIWKFDADARTQEPDLKKFISQNEANLLRSASNVKTSVCEFNATFCGGTRAFKVLMHSSAFSAASVLAMAHRAYLDASGESRLALQSQREAA